MTRDGFSARPEKLGRAFLPHDLNRFESIRWAPFWLFIARDRADWAPVECPRCGELHYLRVRIDVQGNWDPVKCDQCGWDDYSSHEARLEKVVT